MCLTAFAADINDTVLVSVKVKGKITKKNKKGLVRRRLLYSNKIISNAFNPENMMLIALPTTVDTVELIDLTDFGDSLVRQVNNFKYINDSTNSNFGSREIESKGLSVNIEKVGMYTVYYTKNIRDLSKYCHIAKPIIEFYDNYSKDELVYFGFVWEGNVAIHSQPICIEYGGENVDVAYFPTMDSHKNLDDKDDDYLIQHWNDDITFDTLFVYGEEEGLELDIKRDNTLDINGIRCKVDAINHRKSYASKVTPNGDYREEDGELYRVSFDSGNTEMFNL